MPGNLVFAPKACLQKLWCFSVLREAHQEINFLNSQLHWGMHRKQIKHHGIAIGSDSPALFLLFISPLLQSLPSAVQSLSASWSAVCNWRNIQSQSASRSVTFKVITSTPNPHHPISKGASCECACARERYYTPLTPPPTIQSNISPRVANDAVGKSNGLCRLICPRCLGQKPCSKGQPQGVIDEALVWVYEEVHSGNMCLRETFLSGFVCKTM